MSPLVNVYPSPEDLEVVVETPVRTFTREELETIAHGLEESADGWLRWGDKWRDNFYRIVPDPTLLADDYRTAAQAIRAALETSEP